MIPVALAARHSRARGAQAVFLIGFAALPIRGALYTLNGQSLFSCRVQ